MYIRVIGVNRQKNELSSRTPWRCGSFKIKSHFHKFSGKHKHQGLEWESMSNKSMMIMSPWLIDWFIDNLSDWLTDWLIVWLAHFLQLQQESLELVHHGEDSQRLFSLLWKAKAWFTFLDLSYGPPHRLDPLLNHLHKEIGPFQNEKHNNKKWLKFSAIFSGIFVWAIENLFVCVLFFFSWSTTSTMLEHLLDLNHLCTSCKCFRSRCIDINWWQQVWLIVLASFDQQRPVSPWGSPVWGWGGSLEKTTNSWCRPRRSPCVWLHSQWPPPPRKQYHIYFCC